MTARCPVRLPAVPGPPEPPAKRHRLAAGYRKPGPKQPFSAQHPRGFSKAHREVRKTGYRWRSRPAERKPGGSPPTSPTVSDRWNSSAPAESGVKRNIPGPCGKALAVSGNPGWGDGGRDASGAGGTGGAGRQVRGGARGGADGGVLAARPAPAVLDHLRQRYGVRPARAARQRLRDDDLVLRRLRLLAEGGRGERERAAAPRPAARPRPGHPDRRRAAGDRAQPQPDASQVPRLPDAPPGAAQGAWQGRPNPLRLTRCASPVNPPMLTRFGTRMARTRTRWCSVRRETGSSASSR